MDSVFVALINLGPVIRVVVELFRVGTGMYLGEPGLERLVGARCAVSLETPAP